MHLAFSPVKKVEKTTQFLLFKNYLIPLFLLCCTYLTSNAQVVISEVFAGGNFELKNNGTEAVDVSSYIICSFPTYTDLSDLTVTCGSLNLNASETVVLSGFTVLNSPAYQEGDGELGLYNSRDFGNADAIKAYVEWGNGGHQRSSVAVEAGIWTADNAVSGFSDKESLVYDGDGNQASDWSVNTNPSICPTTETTMSVATYTITFDATWSSETHPTEFPSNPHFSPLIGMTHNSNTSLFEENTLATEGIRVMAEFGGNGTLMEEIQAIIMGGDGGTLISGGGIGVSPGSISKEIEAVSTHPLLSLTTMIAPSPDWFVAIKNVPLFENGSWVDEITLDVKNYDSGTDSGRNYNSVNEVTSPQETIQEITDGPLATDGVIPSLGTITIRRQGAAACNLDQRLISTNDATTICVGEGVVDLINVDVNELQDDASYLETAWIITDTTGQIVGLPAGSPFDLEQGGTGTCQIWNLNYEEGIEGLQVGNNVSSLNGCFEFSNAIVITRLAGDACPSNTTDTTDTEMPMDSVMCDVAGGVLSGGPFEFCVGDSIPDNLSVDAITLSGQAGTNSQWIVTDSAGVTILGLPDAPSDVDFEGASAGTCLIWHLSYEDTLIGAAQNALVADLDGCFSLSNAITVVRKSCDSVSDTMDTDNPVDTTDTNNPIDTTDTTNPMDTTDAVTCNVAGGTLSGGPFEFCVGDSIPDNISADAITLSGQAGTNSQWVVTDSAGVTILGLPDAPSDVDFEAAGSGTCLIWHLSYEDTLVGAALRALVADLQGCFSLSNAITVIRVADGSCSNPMDTMDNSNPIDTMDNSNPMDTMDNSNPMDTMDNSNPMDTMDNSNPMDTMDNSNPMDTMDNSNPMDTMDNSNPMDTIDNSNPMDTIDNSNPMDTMDNSNPMDTMDNSNPMDTMDNSNPMDTMDNSNPMDTMDTMDTDETALSCEAPTNPEVKVQNTRKVVVSWTPVENAVRYIFQIRFKGQTRWAATAKLRKAKVRVFAPAGKDYEFHIKTICADGESEYGELQELTTPPRGILTPAESRNDDAFEADIVLTLPRQDLVVAPNPATSSIQLSYPVYSESTYYTIYSVDGKKVLQQPLPVGSFNNTIDIQVLQNGLYILQVFEDGAIVGREKLVKQ